MASPNFTRDPELDSILQSLAHFTPQQAPQPAPQPQPQSTPQHSLGVPNSGDPRSRSATPTTKAPPARPSSTPATDPSTITDWRAAQKYVTFTLAQNQAATTRIPKLIKRQHEHERQWFAGRAALLSKQSGRAEGKRTVDNLLKSLGAPVEESASPDASSTADQNAEELREYDRKVHRALTEMARAMDSELRGMGVPFFAIKHELVTMDDESPNELQTDAAKKIKRLSKEELKDLQKRMLMLLQDLFSG